jgi:Tfp pilus assembly protein PilO
MKNLPKDKRDKMILVAVASVMVLSVVWFMFISPQRSAMAERRSKLAAAEEALNKAKRLAGRGHEIEAEVDKLAAQLTALEQQMAQGDLYSWIIRTMTTFQGHHNVTMPNYNPPSVGPMDVFPDFPYETAAYAFRGYGHFHDIGKFIADLENRFPFASIRNLELDASGISTATSGDDAEKIGFQFDFVTLVKPSTPL